MASIEGPTDGDSSPAANAASENLGVPEEFTVDPITADLEYAKLMKEAAETIARDAAAGDAGKAEDAGKSSGKLSNAFNVITVVAVIAATVVAALFASKKSKDSKTT